MSKTTTSGWRIERAGDAGAGYAPGWLAVTPHGLATWKPTWADALAFVVRIQTGALRSAEEWEGVGWRGPQPRRQASPGQRLPRTAGLPSPVTARAGHLVAIAALLGGVVGAGALR